MSQPSKFNPYSGTASEANVWATMIAAEMMLLIPDSDPDKPVHLQNLGFLWLRRYTQSGDISALENACACLVQVVKLTPDSHPDKPRHLNNLGASSQSWYKHLGELADIDKAIKCVSQAVELTPNSHPNKPELLNVLGVSWIWQFKRLGELADINRAIECQLQAVTLTPDSRPEKPTYLSNLGESWRICFEQLGHLTDLDKAIECTSRAVELTPDGHPEKPGRLHNLVNSWRNRFERFGDLADINKAIECGSRVIELTPDSDPNKPCRLNNLGVSWLIQSERLNDFTYVEKGIKCVSKAVELAPDGHPDKPGCLNNLGIAWLHRFKRLGSTADIDKAIEVQMKAVDLTADGDPEKPGRLHNLGNSWQKRFHRLGDLADIDKAIEYASRAVELSPEDHIDKPGRLHSLGISWSNRSERLGCLADLDKAIKCLSRAVELTPDGHPGKALCLSSLGNSWQSRFKHLGNIADIDKAIEYASRAGELTPENHTAKPSCLNTLGSKWQDRFGRLENIIDSDKAVECLSQAVELTPDSHPDKPNYLCYLGISWKYLFKRFGNITDIDKAIECELKAVELAADDRPDKPGLLSNLGASFLGRFEHLGNLTDLDKAIEYVSQAVKLIPDNHPDRPNCLNNLGISLLSRSEHLVNLADIDKAIECQSQAVELTPDGHPEKPSRLSNLGGSWQQRYKLCSRTEDLEVFIMLFQAGAEIFVISPSIQLDCARKWAAQSHSLGRSPLKAYQRAFILLSHIVSLGQTIQERYDSLLSIRKFADEATAWAVSVELYDLALEWLEQGRSIVWSQTLQLRTPFDEIAKANSGLAYRLRDTASKLDVASSRSQVANISTGPQQDLESQAQQHRRLAELWDSLLAEARQLPGFQGFMLPQTATELKRAATDGPVVIINTHSVRCDALVIFPNCDDVAHIPLSSPINQQLTETCLQVISLVGHRGTGARFIKYFPQPTESQDCLKPLKDHRSGVVGPVLGALACTRQLPYDQLPHVTWCATGALSFVPLHAAGLYDGHSPNALDLVVSSYTPTLSALLPRSDQTVQHTQGVLAVGQAKTQGQPPLPMTEEELAIVKKHTNMAFYHQLEGASATVGATLDAMEQHSWVHLACHAVQNRDNPSHSAFYLHDGCLTLEEIAKRAFKNKGLAFLSACQTATGDDNLPDEATHLAAGMLTAGYPSVIATMWSIMDEDAPQIAEEVYAELIKDGKMDHRNAARALHKAVGKLREKVGLESIDRWAPFIHVGV